MDEDTSGFYKHEGDAVFHAPNYVMHQSFTLLRELHHAYMYPVDGWWWFDNRADACTHFGVEDTHGE
jgi:hypothetical protein